MFDVRVLDVKTAYHQTLVLLHLGRVVGIDEQRVFIERLAGQLVGLKDQIHRVFNKYVLHQNGDSRVGPDVLVKNEVDAAGLGKRIEHHLDAGLAELKADGAGVTGLEQRCADDLAKPACLDVLLCVPGGAVIGILGKHRMQQVQCALDLAQAVRFNRQFHGGLVAAGPLYRFKARGGPGKPRSQRHRAAK